MSKLVRISLARRGVSCVAELLEKEAPRTFMRYGLGPPSATM